MANGEGCSQLACCAVVALIIAVLTVFRFETVHQLEMGLMYNMLTQTIEPKTFSAGIYYCGPWTTMLKWPKTLQNIDFSTGHKPWPDELHARTSDGLPVTLSLSFQYQLLPEQMLALYHDFGAGEDAYAVVFFDVATHLVAEAAASYTAYEFFNERMTIAADMQERLDRVFTAELHATVVSVQIAECSLPQMFNDAVTHTVTQRQNITAAQKYLDSERVSLATELLVARRNANATLAAARGTASAALLAANAMAAVATTQGVYEARAWREAMATLNLSTAQMLEYIWWGEVGDEGGQPGAAAPADLLVGVRPSTLVRSAAPA